MDPRSLCIEDYTYELPQERIAKYPLEIRDASKLLVYKQGEITEGAYLHIADHLPADTLLIFNQTKVIHARLLFKKPTGSTIEVFCLEPHRQYHDIQTAMLQKGKVWWKCMVGGAARWKDGMVLQLSCPDPAFTLSASIVEKENGVYILELAWNNATLTFAEVLHYLGKVPLPPYLNR
jgi:S-adenosylmethionine:tRNA ribosyltransferase-isomerase